MFTRGLLRLDDYATLFKPVDKLLVLAPLRQRLPLIGKRIGQLLILLGLLFKMLLELLAILWRVREWFDVCIRRDVVLNRVVQRLVEQPILVFSLLVGVELGLFGLISFGGFASTGFASELGLISLGGFFISELRCATAAS